jgi:SAM-dependent methyltransferase
LKLQRIITPVLSQLSVGRSFLDIACGYGRWGKIIRGLCRPTYLVGLDVWKPCLLKMKGQKVYDDLVLSDARKLPFKDGSFDVCLACEVIEHMPKREGFAFLSSLEKVPKEMLIVSSPNFDYKQDEVRGNPFEKHVSVWSNKDFQARGYSVKGAGLQFKGKFLFANIPFFRRFFNRIVSSKFVFLAELIVATKKLNVRATL